MDDDDDFDEAKWREQLRFRHEMTLHRTERLIRECGIHPMFDLVEPMTIDDYGVLTIGIWGGWLLQIEQMGFDDRVILTPQQLQSVRDYGWDYERGGSAILALLAWNLETQGEPAAFKRRSGPIRQPGQTLADGSPGAEYLVCLLDLIKSINSDPATRS